MYSVPAPSDVVTVRSPEGVELELPIAGPAPRIAAYSIDLALILVMLVAVLVTFALAQPAASWFAERFASWRTRAAAGDSKSMAIMAPLLLAFVLATYFGELVYFSLWEIATRGLTPGKYLVGLRVVGREGQPVDAKAVLTRNVLRAVDVLPSAYAIGLVAMLTSKYGQRLGDHAAGTLVIRTDRVAAPEALVLPPDLEPLALSREQLAVLGARELTLVRGTLRRLHETQDAQRRALLRQVANTLAARLGVELSDSEKPERFLQQVLLTAQRKQHA
jgi:uncharacterized RDD family membrane protein YckC